MALSLNGVDLGCMNSITWSTCRAKCTNILHDTANVKLCCKCLPKEKRSSLFSLLSATKRQNVLKNFYFSEALKIRRENILSELIMTEARLQRRKTVFSLSTTILVKKLVRLSLPSLSSLVYCLWARPGAYPWVEHLKGSSIGHAPVLPTNIRPGWKGLPGTNTLAYQENS